VSLTLTGRHGPWVQRALCRQVDPELFFPDSKGGSTREARNICRRCEVRAECLELALRYEHDLDRSHRFGVWGGLTAAHRNRLATGTTSEGGEAA
jgi:WhiB family redox-sensing transcriptional regulator